DGAPDPRHCPDAGRELAPADRRRRRRAVAAHAGSSQRNWLNDRARGTSLPIARCLVSQQGLPPGWLGPAPPLLCIRRTPVLGHTRQAYGRQLGVLLLLLGANRS